MSYLFNINYCRSCPGYFRDYSIAVFDQNKKKYLGTLQVWVNMEDKTITFSCGTFHEECQPDFREKIIQFIENYDDLDLKDYK